MYEITRRDLIVSSAAAATVLGLNGRVAFIGAAHAQKAVEHGFYRYKVGDIEVTALYDGLREKPHDPPSSGTPRLTRQRLPSPRPTCRPSSCRSCSRPTR